MQSSVGYPAVRSYLRVSFSGLVAARRVGVISVLYGTASLPESGAYARRARFPLPFLRSSSALPRTIGLLLKREESRPACFKVDRRSASGSNWCLRGAWRYSWTI